MKKNETLSIQNWIQTVNSACESILHLQMNET